MKDLPVLNSILREMLRIHALTFTRWYVPSQRFPPRSLTQLQGTVVSDMAIPRALAAPPHRMLMRWGCPWFSFTVAYFIGLLYISRALLSAHDILSVATWTYAVASSAGFAFFGLSFGEETGAGTEVWIPRARIVQGLQQIWVAALWFWGHKFNNVIPGAFTPGWIVFIVWPLAGLSLLFISLLLFGLPGHLLV